MGASSSFQGENPPWHYRTPIHHEPIHRKPTIKTASGTFRRWKEIRSKDDLLPQPSDGRALLDTTLPVGPGLDTINKPAPIDPRRSSQIPVPTPYETSAARVNGDQSFVSGWPAAHNDFSGPSLETEPYTDTPHLMLLSHLPQDDDLEDLACLDAAISREENHVRVQRRLQALEAQLCWTDVSEVRHQVVVSRYFRDLDEKTYMSHVSVTNYWGAVQEDPIFALIITEPSPRSAQRPREKIDNLIAEADTWCDLTVDRGTDPDSASQASVAISESDGESPSPRTRSVNSDELPEENKRPPSLKPLATPLEALISIPKTVSSNNLDHTEAERYLSFDKYVPTLQFISSDTAIPDEPHHHATAQPPSILAVENLFMAATRRETISTLQYTTPGQYGAFAATNISLSIKIPDLIHAIDSHNTGSMPNIHDPLKGPSQQGRTHSAPTLPTIHPDHAPTRSSAIKINLKVTQPNSGPQSERCSGEVSPRAKLNATKTQQPSDQAEDQQHKSTEPESSQSRPKPPSSPFPCHTKAAIKAKDQGPSSTMILPHKVPTQDDDDNDDKLSPHGPAGRSLRLNPTPSRKRRYSEFEQAQKRTPASVGGRGRGLRGRGGASTKTGLAGAGSGRVGV